MRKLILLPATRARAHGRVMVARIAATALAALAAAGIQAQPGACTATSGPGIAALVELYTSEGCSSCPPADRWLSTLRESGPGPGRLVPLSLHVDYWDYIGWRDPFALPLFSARQRELAGIHRARVVYTPQVVLSGKDYRGWGSGSRFAEAVRAVNATAARARITLELSAAGGGTLELQRQAGDRRPRIGPVGGRDDPVDEQHTAANDVRAGGVTRESGAERGRSGAKKGDHCLLDGHASRPVCPAGEFAPVVRPRQRRCRGT